MLKTSWFSFLCGIFICFSLSAQNTCLIDSMAPVLLASKNDTTKVLKLLDVCNSCKQNRTNEALRYCIEAENLSKKLKFERILPDIYGSIGNCYEYEDDKATALNYYFKALHIAEKQNNHFLISRYNNGIGNIYYSQNNYLLAKKYYLNAYNYASADNRSLRAVLSNLGMIEVYLKNYNQAEKYLLKSIQISKKYNDEELLSYLLNALGTNYTDVKKYPQALFYLKESLQLNTKINDARGIGYDYLALGNVYYRLHNYSEALSYYQKALKQSDKVKDTQLKSAIYDCLSISAEASGNYKNAYKYYLLYKELNDSLFTKEKSRQIAEMNAKYETDQKDLEISTLKTQYLLKESIAKRQTWIIVICIVAVAVSIFLSIFLIKNIRKKNIAYQVLQDKNNLILKQNEKIERQKKELESYSTELEQENILAQFETLKNQVNPHFLFNSLGVLSSLIKKDTDQAYLFTKEFAKIYRVALDLKEHALIYLSEELDFIESYLFLQKIRFSSSLIVNINIADSYFYYAVPPFSLQLLVENAIKHNIISEQMPLFISIYVEDDFLVVKNNIQLRADKNISTGIGNKNLIDRYKILSDIEPAFYPESNYYFAKIPLLKEGI